MNEIYRLETVADYNNMAGVETLHPLVSVIDISKINIDENRVPDRITNCTHLYFGLYAVYYKESICGQVIYGRSSYDYSEGSLVFISPGQVIKIMSNPSIDQRKGWVLLFHPDLIHGTSLGRGMNDYSFFSYEANEALHLSERERKLVFECFEKISYEIDQRIDKHSKKLIVRNIQLFLDYCTRFYDRQFITRETINRGTIEQFERLLNEYFKSDKPQLVGLPSVGYFADKLNLSANYFGDLIKKDTGKTPQEYIHLKIISLAKDRLLDEKKSVSEIAYELGFKYPSHFARMFRKDTGYSPVEYRAMN